MTMVVRQMPDQTYYCCLIRLDGDDKFVIWFEAERDGFVCDSDGRLIWASSPAELATTARNRGISLVAENATLYDFDQISDWIQCRAPERVDCDAFLNAWNFFDDLARIHERPDRNYAKLSWAAANVYDLLFWGCNLPSVTPPGERFEPTWPRESLDEIAAVMVAGIELVRHKLRAA